MAVSETADIRMVELLLHGICEQSSAADENPSLSQIVSTLGVITSLSFQFPPYGIYNGACKDVRSSLRILSEVSTLNMEGNGWADSKREVFSKELLHFLATPFDLEDGEGAQ
ncbi:hypothetical protein FRC02_001674 [Tulasnella sp. 418]|nr:hypothetical protein FRC02_001674 [Tulasnella sp. 418]